MASACTFFPPPPAPRNRWKTGHSATISPFSTRIPTWVCLSQPSPGYPELVSGQKGLPENELLVSLARQGKDKEAIDFVRRMESSGIWVRIRFYERLFEACGEAKSLDLGVFLHEKARAVLGGVPDGPMAISLGKMYMKCSSFARARKVFDEMRLKSVPAWRTIIFEYARCGLTADAVGSVSGMCSAGYEPDPALAVAIVRGLLDHHGSIGLARQVHSYLVRIGMVDDLTVDTALLNMYMELGRLRDSLSVFAQMEETNAVAWTGLMVGHMEEWKPKDALDLFAEMARRGVPMDHFVFSIVLKACSGLANLVLGRQVHGLIVKLGMDSDVSAGTPLVDLYAKCKLILDAERAFQRIANPNEYSWSALIGGYARAGRPESLETFRHLRSRGDGMTNSHQYTSVFQASAAFADSISGRQLHADAMKRGLLYELRGETALMTMYSRSGEVESARRVFDLIRNPDVVAWSAVICGCAYHGEASKTLRYFSRMQRSGVAPNSVTFRGVLSACGHAGLVSQAGKCLNTMESLHGVEPATSHFNCMVEAYCRADRLEEAFRLADGGSFKPDAKTWKILLSGCTAYSNVELGRIAGERLLELEPDDAAAYVLLFNLYASSGKWEDAALVSSLMNERGISRDIGCSWMLVKGEVHRFMAGDSHHPRTAEIYAKLEELARATSGEHLHHANVPREVSKEQLLEHSEKIAVAVGLVCTPDGSSITVFKNLRMCRDCHSFCKSVSETARREIIIRDSGRFHHIKDGACSCKDYW